MPTLVTADEARLEAAERVARTEAVLVPLWRAARLWTIAVVMALFPLLFIVDQRIETRLSPVLPGLAALLLLILVLPFILVEMAGRRYRRKDMEWQTRHAMRSAQNGRTAAIVALIWAALWFAVGT